MKIGEQIKEDAGWVKMTSDRRSNETFFGEHMGGGD